MTSGTLARTSAASPLRPHSTTERIPSACRVRMAARKSTWVVRCRTSNPPRSTVGSRSRPATANTPAAARVCAGPPRSPRPSRRTPGRRGRGRGSGMRRARAAGRPNAQRVGHPVYGRQRHVGSRDDGAARRVHHRDGDPAVATGGGHVRGSSLGQVQCEHAARFQRRVRQGDRPWQTRRAASARSRHPATARADQFAETVPDHDVRAADPDGPVVLAHGRGEHGELQTERVGAGEIARGGALRVQQPDAHTRSCRTRRLPRRRRPGGRRFLGHTPRPRTSRAGTPPGPGAGTPSWST